MNGLISLLLFGLVAYLLMRAGCGAHVGHGGHHGYASHSRDDEADARPRRTFVDPVCRMKVGEEQGYLKHHKGMAYHFCSKECLNKFEADPALYLSRDAPPPDPAHRGGY